LKKANPGEKTAYVLWEPDVSKALAENPALHVVTSSNDEAYLGKIVDVFVVQKVYLEKKENREAVKKILEAYFQTLEAVQNSRSMVQLVMDDAKRTGTEMTREEAEKVVKGIGWRNAKMNYAQFKIDETLKTTSVDQMILDLAKLLVESNVISRTKDPTQGDGGAAKLFDKTPLQELYTAKFGTTTAGGPPPATKLDEKAWKQLKPVSKFELEKIAFSKASEQFNPDLAIDSLNQAAKIMKEYPTLYLEIRGFVPKDSDSEPDRKLKLTRATYVANLLTERGVPADRIRAVAGAKDDPLAKDSQGVSFVLLEKPAQ
jgi:outer membrane protein OmpA-like peptidoglycan-associated protein